MCLLLEKLGKSIQTFLVLDSTVGLPWCAGLWKGFWRSCRKYSLSVDPREGCWGRHWAPWAMLSCIHYWGRFCTSRTECLTRLIGSMISALWACLMCGILTQHVPLHVAIALHRTLNHYNILKPHSDTNKNDTWFRNPKLIGLQESPWTGEDRKSAK